MTLYQGTLPYIDGAITVYVDNDTALFKSSRIVEVARVDDQGRYKLTLSKAGTYRVRISTVKAVYPDFAVTASNGSTAGTLPLSTPVVRSSPTVPSTTSPGGTGGSGTPGAAGRGITSAAINGSGRLILTMTDGSTIDAGVAKGADGTAGAGGGSSTPLGIFPMYQAANGTWSGPVDPKTAVAGQLFMWSLFEGGAQPTVANGFVAARDIFGPVGLVSATGSTPPTGGTTTPATPTVNPPATAQIITSESFNRANATIAPSASFVTDAALGGTAVTWSAWTQAGLSIASNQLAVNGANTISGAAGPDSGVIAFRAKIAKLPTAGALRFEMRDTSSGYKKVIARINPDGAISIGTTENSVLKQGSLTTPLAGMTVVAGDTLVIRHDTAAGTTEAALSGTKVFTATGWQVAGTGNAGRFFVFGGDTVNATGNTVTTAGAIIDDLYVDKDVLTP